MTAGWLVPTPGTVPGALAGAPPPTSAFPGATGFGADSAGGRGGDVYRVTTLVDDGPGSLRAGITTAAAPRTIVFAVSGTIDLQSPLRVTADHLTIAGQTSPGGVTLRGYPLEIVDSSHVVLRYLRVRTGDVNGAAVGDTPARGNGDLLGDAADAISVLGSEHVIIDHVSASWGMDETLSVTGSTNVTVQYSIISESLDDSHHTEGPHGYGSLVRGTGGPGVTFWRNLWAHHQRRLPGLGGRQDPPPDAPPAGLDVDLVNNVHYDWLLLSTHALEDPQGLRVNLEGSTYIAGPSLVGCPCVLINFEATAEELAVHRADVALDPDGDTTADPRPAQDTDTVGPVTWLPDRIPFDRPQPDVLPASEAYVDVLCRAGASDHRDAVDARVVDQVIHRTGHVIDSQDEVGGYPTHDAPPPPPDADADGMADAWEAERGLDPSDPSDRNGTDLDPAFTNLEIYLDALAGDPPDVASCEATLEAAAAPPTSADPTTPATPTAVTPTFTG